ncbi:hypothetical protein [Nostoc sp.]|uniref:hypothetical protein n=1 Tax=Nostoc sp. TaxID=1180 RepID=UPI002FF9A544
MTLTPALRAKVLVMSADALLKWKSQILDYQQRVRENKPPEQTALFDIAPNHCDPDRIDPLLLRLVPMSFYRVPADSPGDACLYFVVDSAAGLILYVGETCRSDKRWKGRANASKLLSITTKIKNQRKNQDFAFDYFLSPKAIA